MNGLLKYDLFLEELLLTDYLFIQAVADKTKNDYWNKINDLHEWLLIDFSYRYDKSFRIDDRRHNDSVILMGDFENIPVSFFKHTNFNRLFIQSKKLKRLPRFINRLKHLKFLSAIHSGLIDLPETLKDLKLETLEIQNNKFKKIPKVVSKLNLNKFIAYNNLIETVPEWFYQLNFEILHLAKNRLDEEAESRLFNSFFFKTKTLVIGKQN